MIEKIYQWLMCVSWYKSHTSHMYARVYKCTHCGRKGHLARFYFDRLNSTNFSNKNIWVPYNANPRGLSHDVRGMVPWWWMHVELDGHTLLMHLYQGSLVGGLP